MISYIDIHTHRRKQGNNRISFYNCNYSELHCVVNYFSLSIHPWEINNKTAITKDIFYNLPKNCVAIGEIGLDKLHNETFEHQKIIFEKTLQLLPGKTIPVIIHCVKAHTDLIQIIKHNNVKNPFIIHGFNSSSNILKIYLKENYYISVGKILFGDSEKAKMILNNIPNQKLFLETDDTNYSIEEVYTKAASLMNITIDNLKTIIFENAKKIFTQLQ